jgi:hypothetical protein
MDGQCLRLYKQGRLLPLRWHLPSLHPILYHGLEREYSFSLGAWQFKGSQVLAIVSILVLSGINLRYKLGQVGSDHLPLLIGEYIWIDNTWIDIGV